MTGVQPCEQESTPAATQAVADATGAALQADGARALEALRCVPAAEFAGDDPASPHAYANKRVLGAIARRLGLPAGAALDAVDIARLNAAAGAELRADTGRRLPAERRPQ